MKLLSFLRRFLGLCDHDWVLVKQVKLNEFSELGEWIDVVSEKDFSMFRCTKCKDVKFRKI